MTISAAPLIYILIFVAVLFLVEGIYLTVFGKSISLNSRVSRRLALMEKGGNREQVLEVMYSFQVNDYFKVVPHFQYIANPAYSTSSENILWGVQAVFSF